MDVPYVNRHEPLHRIKHPFVVTVSVFEVNEARMRPGAFLMQAEFANHQIFSVVVLAGKIGCDLFSYESNLFDNAG